VLIAEAEVTCMLGGATVWRAIAIFGRAQRSRAGRAATIHSVTETVGMRERRRPKLHLNLRDWYYNTGERALLPESSKLPRLPARPCLVWVASACRKLSFQYIRSPPFFLYLF